MKAKGLAKAKYWIIGGVLLVIVVLLGLSRTTLPHLGLINVRGVYTQNDNSYGTEEITTVVYRNGEFASSDYSKNQNGCKLIPGLKSIFETDFKRHSEPRLPSTAQINH